MGVTHSTKPAWPRERSASPCAVVAAVLGLVLGVLAGCTRERVVHDGWGWLKQSEWSDGRKRDEPQPKTTQPAPTPRGAWTIQLVNLDGRDRHKKAQTLARQAQTSTRMAEVWVEDVDKRTRVLAGRYRSPDEWGAQEDLNQLRFIEVDGEYPFAGAELIPVGDGSRSAKGTAEGGDEAGGVYDLKRYVGMFTLQIGFYDDSVGPRFRKAAEDAVKILREQGEQAYFYHGPNRSLICLGLFTEKDFSEEGGVRIYGPRIKELQSKYPHNLANGYTLVEKHDGQSLGEQPSFLVRIF